jgi:hypothetical protein
VYTYIANQHREINTLAKQYFQEMAAENMSQGKRHFQEMRCKVTAIGQVWRETLGMIQGETSLPRSVVESMIACRPEGVIFSSRVENITCRKHSVCPWCSYRHGMSILKALEPYLQPDRKVGRLTVRELIRPGSDQPQLEVVKKLVRNLCKDRRRWIVDWVVYRPCFDTKAKKWMISATIVAIGEKETDFPDPEPIVARMKVSEFPALFGGRWEIRAAFKKNLAEAVGEAIRVPVEALTIDRRDEFAEFATLGAKHRSESHGLRRTRSRRADLS